MVGGAVVLCAVVAGGLVAGVGAVAVLLGGSVGVMATSSSFTWRRFWSVAPTAWSRRTSACVRVSLRISETLRVGAGGGGGGDGQVTMVGGFVAVFVGG